VLAPLAASTNHPVIVTDYWNSIKDPWLRNFAGDSLMAEGPAAIPLAGVTQDCVPSLTLVPFEEIAHDGHNIEDTRLSHGRLRRFWFCENAILLEHKSRS
jgi:hypothetical protein